MVDAEVPLVRIRRRPPATTGVAGVAPRPPARRSSASTGARRSGRRRWRTVPSRAARLVATASAERKDASQPQPVEPRPELLGTGRGGRRQSSSIASGSVAVMRFMDRSAAGPVGSRSGPTPCPALPLPCPVSRPADGPTSSGPRAVGAGQARWWGPGRGLREELGDAEDPAFDRAEVAACFGGDDGPGGDVGAASPRKVQAWSRPAATKVISQQAHAQVAQPTGE